MESLQHELQQRLGYRVRPLDSIIFTGLPRIETAMRFAPDGLTWVQDAYTLVFGGLMLPR